MNNKNIVVKNNFKVLSILIPVYNEANTINKLLDKVRRVKLSLKKEIICVDDGSKDGTYEALLKYSKKHSEVKCFKHKVNKGKGAAIRTAIKYATGDIVLIQDADLEYDPNDYPALIKPIINSKATVVYGSRRLRSDNKQHSGLSFYVGGVGLTFITNLLYRTKITDEPTCYKVFRTDIIKSIPLECTRFEFCPEVTAKVAKRKIPIYEVPIKYYPRSSKEGKKIRWKDGVEAVWTLVKYRFKD